MHGSAREASPRAAAAPALLVQSGENPAGMMQMGDALHAVEDYFSHSNFVEACMSEQT